MDRNLPTARSERLGRARDGSFPEAGSRCASTDGRQGTLRKARNWSGLCLSCGVELLGQAAPMVGPKGGREVRGSSPLPSSPLPPAPLNLKPESPGETASETLAPIPHEGEIKSLAELLEPETPRPSKEADQSPAVPAGAPPAPTAPLETPMTSSSTGCRGHRGSERGDASSVMIARIPGTVAARGGSPRAARHISTLGADASMSPSTRTRSRSPKRGSSPS